MFGFGSTHVVAAERDGSVELLLGSKIGASAAVGFGKRLMLREGIAAMRRGKHPANTRNWQKNKVDIAIMLIEVAVLLTETRQLSS